MKEGADAPRARPGTVYKLREFKISPDLPETDATATAPLDMA
jgi:acetolactate synthase-1/2/3 large subunit